MLLHHIKYRALLSFFGIAFTLLLGTWSLIRPVYAATAYELVCPPDGDGPEAMLRTAITELNTKPEFDSLVISITGADCLFTLEDAAGDYGNGPVGLPRITRNLSMRASGGQAVIERSTNASRFRLMESYANLTLEHVTLRHGKAASTPSDSRMSGSAIYAHQALTLTNVLVTENAGDQGGAIYATGTLVMDQVTVSHNYPQSGFESTGGGIFAVGHLFATNITVTDNLSALKGGGVYVGGSAIISAATFYGNRAQHYNGIGGGLYVTGDLTLSNSHFISNSAGLDGGGIYVEGASSFVEVHFIDNAAGNSGGGIAAAKYPLATIEASHFINNKALLGGGAWIQRGIVQNTHFENNRAGGSGYYFGGGALLVGSQATIQNNRFISNSAPIGGAVQFLFYPPDGSSGASHVINNLWIDNEASQGNGGALAIGIDLDGFLGKYIEINHNTIVRQTRGVSSALFIARTPSDIANNIITLHRIGLHGAGATVLADANLFYANVTNYIGIGGTSDDLDADPLFVDPANHDYHLQTGSPAKDTGLDWDADVDLDGVSRPQGKGYDRGAYEIPFINHAPLGQADTYTTVVDTTLVITAPGVLVNDSDPEGDVLTATVVTVPAHGEVALQPAGALIYTPTASFTGTDSFTYQASDGLNISQAITVTLVVEPDQPSPPSPVAITGLQAKHAGPAIAGRTVNFVASVATGSDILFVWDFGDGASAEDATVSHIYAEPGDYTVALTASNLLGSDQVTTTVVVLPDAEVSRRLFSPFIVK